MVVRWHFPTKSKTLFQPLPPVFTPIRHRQPVVGSAKNRAYRYYNNLIPSITYRGACVLHPANPKMFPEVSSSASCKRQE